MNKDEALKLALNFVEDSECGTADLEARIKEALAQPEQEPVAWGFQNTAITGSNRWMMLREEVPADDQYNGALWTPLYTTPPQRKPLSDEEIYSLADSLEIWNEDDEEWILDPNTFARAIEAKLKEKI